MNAIAGLALTPVDRPYFVVTEHPRYEIVVTPPTLHLVRDLGKISDDVTFRTVVLEAKQIMFPWTKEARAMCRREPWQQHRCCYWLWTVFVEREASFESVIYRIEEMWAELACRLLGWRWEIEEGGFYQ